MNAGLALEVLDLGHSGGQRPEKNKDPATVRIEQAGRRRRKMVRVGAGTLAGAGGDR
jgi:hypothetical protein